MIQNYIDENWRHLLKRNPAPHIMIFHITSSKREASSFWYKHANERFLYRWVFFITQMRTVRLGLANACWCLGSVLGLLLSGLLFQSGGEILVFSAALGLEVMAFVVSAWRVS